VFNLDEVGISQWENKVEKKVIVPSAVGDQMIFHSVHRNSKHISIVACISAAGEHMTLFMVCSRLHGTVERLLELRGFRLGVELIVGKRDKPYMDSQLFYEYIPIIPIHYIDELPTSQEFASKDTVLFMDNWAIHVQLDTLRFLANHQGKVTTLPPHTDQIFQSFDPSLFANLKKNMNDRVPLETDETTAGSMKRIFHAMEQTLVEDNVGSAFLQLGLQYDIDTGRYVLRFGEYTVRQSPGFTSLWQPDHADEKLSLQRQNATFSWVNKTMCPEWATREYSFIS
jgi:hypothetical protein